ncbi:hypothetical protein FOZ60_010648 [Perkinsus olseni]|uniref:Uncharacterized protein n=1 Tax=Perkinsus olseni TaxID=32597 RepID=A0A7J6NH52_PEROL|nr:hypothetical protein FOZ60_010648 [Perkinsus olseni]
MMVRELILVAFFGLVPANGSIVVHSAIEPGTYESVAAVDNLTKILVVIEPDIMTSLHFFLSGMTLPTSVGPHKLEPDGAGFLVFSKKKLFERRLLTRSFEKLEETRPDIFASLLDWRDMKVCQTTSGTLTLLVFEGDALVLRKADVVLPGGSTHDHGQATERARRQETAGRDYLNPMNAQSYQGTPEPVERTTAAEPHTRQPQPSMAGSQREAPRAKIPPSGVYENDEPIPGFEKVKMTLVKESLTCWFEFHYAWSQNPRKVGPCKMAVSLHSWCLVFDSDDASSRMKVTWAFNRLSDDLARQNHGRISSSLFKVCFATQMQTELVIGVKRYAMKLKPPLATATLQFSNSPDSPAEGSETISGRRWAGGDQYDAHSIATGVPGRKRAATESSPSGPLKQSRRQPKSRVEPKLAARPPPPGVYHNVFPILNLTEVEMNLTTDLECQFKFWIPGLATPVSVGPHRIVASLLDDCYMFDHRDNVALGRTTWAFRHLSDELALRRLPGMSSVDLEVCTSPLLQVDLVIKKRRYPMRFGEATRLVLTGSKTALKSFLQNRGHQSDYGKDLPLFAGANDWPLEELMQGSQASYLPDDMLNEVVYNDLSWSPSDLSAGFFDLIENVGGTEAGASTRALGASGEEMLHRPAGYQAFGN